MKERPPPIIETLFLEIVELPGAERRRALDERCGHDAALRAHVERLLRADDANHEGTGLDGPAAHWPRTQVPTRVGGYQVSGIAGEGGTGTVFDAVHESTRRRAAIKLIRSGLLSVQGRQRLAIEAETLGRLNHEGVARLYEAGVAEVEWADGGGGAASRSPFIAMEFVENAASVTQFAREKGLSPRECVGLMARVARAVQHAHQRGVIHRDLKPGNVLVDVATGVPKVVDFGIARLTDADLTAVTHTGQVLGTLRYMSPEQAGGDPALIDARTDIYSLGAMLYELLAGRPVIDAPSGSSAAALVQLVNTDPPRLASLRREFRGDLDAIVHKAIRREPEDRYASAAALADDLENYLAGREVSARAPAVSEQVARFVRRNKALAAAVVLVAVSISAGAAAATWGLVQADRARREEARQRGVAETQSAEAQRQKAEADRQRVEAEAQRAEAVRRREEAEAVTGFLTNDVLSKAGPEMLPDKAVRDVIVRQLIDPAAAVVGERFKDRPLVEAAVRGSIGKTYTAVGRADLALPQHERALEIHRRVLGEEDLLTIASMSDVGFLYQQQGRIVEAESLYRQSLERRRRVLGENDRRTLSSMANLGHLLFNRGDVAEAESLWRTVLERSRATLPVDDPFTLNSANNLASVFERQGKLSDAEPLRREVLDARLRLLGERHPDTLIAMNNMSFLMAPQKKFAEAEALARRTLTLRREVLGDDHPDTTLSINNLSDLLVEMRRLDEAEPLAREAYERRLRLLGDRHPNTITAASNLGLLLHRLGKTDEADAVLRVALAGRRALYAEDDALTVLLLDNMSFFLHRSGRFAEAMPLSREALARAKAGTKPALPPRLVSQIAGNYARCLDGLNRGEEAAAVRSEYGLPPPGATRPSTQAATRAATRPSTQAATRPTPDR